jgi:hypothetical protein
MPTRPRPHPKATARADGAGAQARAPAPHSLRTDTARRATDLPGGCRIRPVRAAVPWGHPTGRAEPVAARRVAGARPTARKHNARTTTGGRSYPDRSSPRSSWRQDERTASPTCHQRVDDAPERPRVSQRTGPWMAGARSRWTARGRRSGTGGARRAARARCHRRRLGLPSLREDGLVLAAVASPTRPGRRPTADERTVDLLHAATGAQADLAQRLEQRVSAFGRRPGGRVQQVDGALIGGRPARCSIGGVDTVGLPRGPGRLPRRVRGPSPRAAGGSQWRVTS